MKIITLACLGFALMISAASYAGVAEKKAIRVLTAEIETATAGMQAACNNAELTSTIEVGDEFTAHNISIATTNMREFFVGMLEVCKDADYREEISKIQQLVFSLTSSESKTGTDTTIYGEIKLESETLLYVTLHVRFSMSNGVSSTLPNVIKALY